MTEDIFRIKNGIKEEVMEDERFRREAVRREDAVEPELDRSNAALDGIKEEEMKLVDTE